ncbi:hypothetical protein FACS1894105_08660 [Clostridia bacterium]|nr:hypothetical protein FACS1894105_08660 [Clostridia bacterium]
MVFSLGAFGTFSVSAANENDYPVTNIAITSGAATVGQSYTIAGAITGTDNSSDSPGTDASDAAITWEVTAVTTGITTPAVGSTSVTFTPNAAGTITVEATVANGSGTNGSTGDDYVKTGLTITVNPVKAGSISWTASNVKVGVTEIVVTTTNTFIPALAVGNFTITNASSTLTPSGVALSDSNKTATLTFTTALVAGAISVKANVAAFAAETPPVTAESNTLSKTLVNPQTLTGNEIGSIVEEGQAKDTLTSGSYTPGALYGKDNDYYIDLEAELLIPHESKTTEDPKATWISVDGGNKWKSVTIPAAGYDLSKLLKKSTTIWLTTSYDKKAKAPTAYVAGVVANAATNTEAVAPVAGAAVWKFPAIAERPKLDKFAIAYTAPTNGTGGDWEITGNTTQTLQTTTAGADKKPVVTSWSALTSGAIPADLVSNKQVTEVKFVRVAPVLTAGSYAPGSAAKKFSIKGVSKAPSYKIDFKKGIIKVKAGTVYVTDAAGNPNATPPVSGELGSDPFGTPLSAEDAKAGISIEGNKTFALRTVPYDEKTAKKPASAIQYIYIPAGAPFDKTAAATKIKVTTDHKLTIDKAYEFLDGEKWVSKPSGKATVTTQVRLKSTAKFDAKTGKTTGNVASQAANVTITWGTYTVGSGESATDKEGWLNVSFPE